MPTFNLHDANYLDNHGSFLLRRMRRNRRTPWSRQLVRENIVTVDDLIWPLFIIEGANVRRPIESMPGVFLLSIDQAALEALRAIELGIPMIALFPYVDKHLRDCDAKEALNPDSLICRALKYIRQTAPGIGLMADVALDPYTSHGHDGIIDNGDVVNDATVMHLVQQAILYAEAGADVVAPSDMMDGRVGAIRMGLDNAGFINTQIMAYTVKYASAFYGPFRDAIGTKGNLAIDKATYQMDPGNSDEALLEAAIDIKEGADMLIVKPGLLYLDVLYRIKSRFKMPTFAYQVSGEFAMIQGAAERGWIEGPKAMMESIIAFKRAGADGIITYFAPMIASFLKNI